MWLQNYDSSLHVGFDQKDWTLPEIMSAYRRNISSGKKTLLVLDQFEQWLHANDPSRQGELVQAIRQCDGTHLQVLLVVRDDFWMAITEFMRSIDVPLREDFNSAAAPLFDKRHARRVLEAFGRANDSLPFADEPLTRPQTQFIKNAVDALSSGGMLISASIALLAEMSKRYSWSPALLDRYGGVESLGMSYLGSIFEGPTAPPNFRRLSLPARRVLAELVPASGSTLKGAVKNISQLREASGLSHSSDQFAELMRMLDRDLYLVTPVDTLMPTTSEALASNALRTSDEQRRYQLTHDFLVAPLRKWLHGKAMETWAGRESVEFGERAKIWRDTHQSRLLPSSWEWLKYSLALPRRERTSEQTTMLRMAKRRTMIRGATGLIALIAIGGGYTLIRGRMRNESLEMELERLMAIGADGVIKAVQDLGSGGSEIRERLRNAPQAVEPEREFRVSLLLALLGDDSKLALLIEELPLAEDLNFAPVVMACQINRPRSTELLAEVLRSKKLVNLPFSDKSKESLSANEQTKSIRAEDAYRVRCGLVLAANNSEVCFDLLSDAVPRELRNRAIVRYAGSTPAQELAIKYLYDNFSNPEGDAGTLAACVLICGSSKIVEPQRKQELSWRLRDLFSEHPDSGVHAAARWGLHKLGFRTPTLVSRQAEAGPNVWRETAVGDFTYIPPSEIGSGERGIWVCGTETTNGEFESFLNAAKYSLQLGIASDQEALKDPVQVDMPMLGLSHYAAAAYCNWLSQRENLQPYYELEANSEQVGIKNALPGQSGYRMPTFTEAIAIQEEGLRGSCFLGGPSAYDLVEHYCHLDGSSIGPLAVATKFPSRRGCFDLIGNASELYFDSNEQDDFGIFGLDYRRSALEISNQPTPIFSARVSGPRFGLRIVRNDT